MPRSRLTFFIPHDLNRPLLRFGLIILSVALSGCVFSVPFIQAFKESGFTENDRKALLPKAIKDFQDALFWNDQARVLALVKPESQESVAATLRSFEGMKMVEAKVSSLSFEPGANTATAIVTIRFYKVPFYVVKSQDDSQKWEFSTGSGWRLMSREVGAERAG